MSAELPVARVERKRGAGWTRVLPLLAALLALALLREVWRERGPRITLHAEDGHGLRPGDALRHRGIEVGTVERVALAQDGTGVEIGVRLARSARALAAEGARFWVARPVLGVEGVRGLETALGARYLALLPAPPGAPPCRDFVALSEPPLFESEEPGALEVVLLADARSGLARGAPVLYRGFPVGVLVGLGLASDASAVELRVRIHAPYAELVRVDSRFWRTRGAELSLGLGGLALAIDSAQSLWLGGIALATPTQPGARAAHGQRFELASEPEEEWTRWRPALPVGSASLPLFDEGGVALPARSFARLSWKPRGWFARERARTGWLVDEGSAWLGPADVLVVPEDAAEAALELGGERLALDGPPSWQGGALARRAHAPSGATPPRLAERALAEPEDVLLLADPALAPIAVAASHLTRAEHGWELAAGFAPEIGLDGSWNGALVLARADGAWLGLLSVQDGRGRVVPLPSD